MFRRLAVASPRVVAALLLIALLTTVLIGWLGLPSRSNVLAASDPGAEPFFAAPGWSYREAWGRWTIGPQASLRFGATSGDRLVLHTYAYRAPGENGRRVEFSLNGRPLGEGVVRAWFDQPPQTFTFDLTGRLLEAGNQLDVRVDRPRSPTAADGLKDDRALGLALIDVAVTAGGQAVPLSPLPPIEMPIRRAVDPGPPVGEVWAAVLRSPGELVTGIVRDAAGWPARDGFLFTSPYFLFGLLPVTFVAFYGLLGAGLRRWALAWLVVASAFYYAWWQPRDLLIVGGSIAFNYLAGRAIAAAVAPWRRAVLAAAIAADLGLLAWFKYAGFLGGLMGAGSWTDLALPLGISFFTFTQIAYLVDTYRGEVTERSPLGYALFVSFFPHLVAGPILHHREMMPQFAAGVLRFSATGVGMGCALIAIGLAKKVLLADSLAPFVAGAYGQVGLGHFPDAATAWATAVAYSLQLYFDFSGYSDMAIGLALTFGIVFPLNFDSPFKATSIIDFWRRWHMTLSRFLKDYVYIPLGGNRQGPRRRDANLLATMLLGGLWHGGAWTYVVWGGLHGAFLLVNHQFRRSRAGRPALVGWRGALAGAAGWGLTATCVVAAFVVFRAPDLEAAGRVLAGMAGLHEGIFDAASGNAGGRDALASILPGPFLVLATVIAVGAPNSQQLVAWLFGRTLTGEALPSRAPAPVAWGSAFALGAGTFFAVLAYWRASASPFLYGSF